MCYNQLEQLSHLVFLSFCPCQEAGIDARFSDIGAAIQETIEPMSKHSINSQPGFE